MRNDISNLLEGIDESKEEKITTWSFRASLGISYSVFVGSKSNQVLGCIKAKDKTRVSEEEWKEIWGEPDGGHNSGSSAASIVTP